MVVVVGFVVVCGFVFEMLKVKFSLEKYGVKGSLCMVVVGKLVFKGGGCYVVGKKYKIVGKWYYFEYDLDYKKIGFVFWYGLIFYGCKMVNGEIFD